MEDVASATFASQGFALALLPISYILTTDLPYHLILSFQPAAIDMANSQTMFEGMEQAGALAGLISLLPIIRLMGLAMLFFAGAALATSHRRIGYLSIIPNAAVSRTIGWASIAVGILLILTQGLYAPQAALSTQRTMAVISGATAPQAYAQTASAGPEATSQVRPSRPAPSSSSLTPGLDGAAQLSYDRPFPPNGTIERKLALGGNVAVMMFNNRSSDNVVAMWFYKIGDGGEQEALRAYVAAGQSVIVQLPTFDYRMAAFEAPTSKGLDAGFGPQATMHDLGYVNLKIPASAEVRHYVYTLIGGSYGINSNGITSNLARPS